ncbi:MAG TPA: FAD-dependent oxidoreductase [Solirubrobacteraceae bacterium]|nr:FAD-dependent oxidoreductase [Solirubrobacteraceae bacterium]
MSPAPGTSENPLRVAIVGSGPAGFYAADRLLKAADLVTEVGMFERLTTPWGLVRAGVAPDHPNIKAVTRVYEKTAALPGFRFHGNVEIGVHVSHEELAAHHHAVLYAIGSPTDRRLAIPGEELAGSHAATEFVAWYNGHPEYCDHEFDLSGSRAVVIGNGNVALDVARMLALTHEELRTTDIADHALEALAHSRIEEIVVLGRRGPVQAAYTNPELRELGELEAADVIVDPADVELDEHSRAFLESDAADITARRNVEIVTDYAGRAPAGKPKRLLLRFLASPIALVGSDRVEAITIARNELVRGPNGAITARQTEVTETIEADLVLRSIGYKGSPVPGLPFDERRAVIHNDGGRVTFPETDEPMPGVYAAGWIKRGPSGVIGTNKKCAQETVALLLGDLTAGRLPEPSGSAEDFADLLAERRADRIGYEGWLAIDAHERALGEQQGRPRVKLTRTEDLLRVAREQQPAPR